MSALAGRTERVRGEHAHARRLALLPRISRDALVDACRRLAPEDIGRALVRRTLPAVENPYYTFHVVCDERSLVEAERNGLEIIARAEAPDMVFALQRAFGSGLCGRAVNRLKRVLPEFSAARRLTSGQAAVLLAVASGFAAGWWLAPQLTAWTASALFAILFLSVSGLRLLSLMPGGSDAGPPPPELADDELPTYTVLVPLHRETDVLGQLVRSLINLRYPASRLDIKLVLEETDLLTRRFVRRMKLPAHFETLIVPRRDPQTKPKALSYALSFARGELVTVYDAEDVASPDQLRVAARTFAAGPADLVCLQAPLAFYNAHQNWLARQTAVEYATLYDLILPAFARLGFPIPLGGTSNHFNGLM